MNRTSKRRHAQGYRHPEASALLRPDIGTQAQFRKKKKPITYRYDSSLSPALDWDGRNPAREQAEAKIAALQERTARLATMIDAGNGEGIPERDLADVRQELAAAREEAAALKALSAPFLDWSGKAERLSFDVPTLPLFVHERLSTAAILETLKGHTRERQTDMFDLFGESDLPDPRPAAQGLRAPRRLGEPACPRRFARGDELAAPLRGARRPGADRLHGPRPMR